MSPTPATEAQDFMVSDVFLPEELADELKPYVLKAENGMLMLKHPLVQMVPFAEPMNRMANHALRQKRQWLEQAEAKEDWENWLFIHERPHRARALLEAQHRMPDRVFWKLVGLAWTDTEQASLNVWPLLWGSTRPGRAKYVMRWKDQKVWKALPDLLTLYRGEDRPRRNPARWSWTLDRDRAIWFARRWASKSPRLLTIKVPKSEALAYFDSRREKEVVLRRDAWRRHKPKVERVPVLEVTLHQEFVAGLMLHINS